tara:strand:+ start:139 stop:480 length:342 start_codon:yes stop_codon:yes gene_type:complete
MAITHTETIKGLEVLTANNDNIVRRIVVTIDSSDDSNPSKYKFTSTDTFDISTTGITTSTSGFVAYEDLTESIVKGWISADLSTSKQKGFNSSIINQMIEKEGYASTDKTIPW